MGSKMAIAVGFCGVLPDVNGDGYRTSVDVAVMRYRQAKFKSMRYL